MAASVFTASFITAFISFSLVSHVHHSYLQTIYTWKNS